MISSYAMHGMGKDAIRIFKKMEKEENIKPNEVTFLNLFNACSHRNFVKEVLYYFDYMKNKYQIKPNLEHETSYIDALGRSQKIQQAKEYLKTKMINKPTIVPFTTLLGAIRSYGTLEDAKEIGEMALKIDPYASAIYVLLGNTYAKFGRFDEKNKILDLMKERGIKKIPGK